MAARRPRLARLLSARRRADLGPARLEGRPLLRHRAARRPPARAGAHADARAQPVSRRARLPGRRARLHGGAHAARPRADGRHRAEPGPRRRLLRRPLHGRPADPVPHLQLPDAAGARRPGRAMGRRRAHRLRPAHDPAAGRRRRPAGQAPRAGLDRRAAGARLLRLQHRRHARPHDRRPLPLDAAPRGPQHLGPRPAVVPALLRPELRRARAADRGPAARPRWSTTAPRAGTAPTCTPSTAPTATTCSPRCRRCFRSCGTRCCRAEAPAGMPAARLWV